MHWLSHFDLKQSSVDTTVLSVLDWPKTHIIVGLSLAYNGSFLLYAIFCIYFSLIPLHRSRYSKIYNIQLSGVKHIQRIYNGHTAVYPASIKYALITSML